jgi:hypothetical protein
LPKATIRFLIGWTRDHIAERRIKCAPVVAVGNSLLLRTTNQFAAFP